MDLYIGDKVYLIDDTLCGKVTALEGDHVHILCEDGFQFEVLVSKVIKMGDKMNHISLLNIEKSKQDTDYNKSSQSAKKKRENYLEIDLHAYHLKNNLRGMTPHQILLLQLNEAKNKLSMAINQHIGKVIFIHGVGEGVLREELSKYFRSLSYVDYYDADYKIYGRGATEVTIYFSKI